MKKRVLILCTGNSCRSQMAEGIWRHYGGDQWDVYSAGLAPAGVNPFAVRALAELDIDISGQTSDPIDDFVDQPFDLVVTLCRNADAHCPVFAGSGEKLHWPFSDPVNTTGDHKQVLEAFRYTRDQIAARICEYLTGRAIGVRWSVSWSPFSETPVA